MKKNFALVFALCFAVFFQAPAQCNLYGKTKCLPRLKPYLNTEQLYNATLLPGDRTRLRMTFYYGDEYRIIICGQEALGKMQLNLVDKDNNVLFTSTGYGTLQWDFNVQNTQDLTLEIMTAPSAKEETFEKSGCVSIVVGFK
jgi:hypothetical protein